MTRTPFLLVGCLLLASLAGCEYFVSDVATRIRYKLDDERARLLASDDDTRVVELKPNHWPDSCGKAPRYRVVLSPYKGNKAVAVGDIQVFCEGATHYWTGMGSEKLVVDRELAVVKRADEALRITLRKGGSGLVKVTGLD